MSDQPDYYAILEISPKATSEQIRTAYKKAALKWHPDRVPVESPERPSRTRKFQKINDAYYTLSNDERRRDYDEARRWHTTGTASGDPFAEAADEEIPRPKAGGGGFPWSAFGFGGGQPSTDSERSANDQFEQAFNDMMHDDLTEGEGEAKKPNGMFWAIVGTLSGATLGFIFANVPGALAGGTAGNRMGHLRDQKGQSVYKTFQELPQNEKAQLLSQLAAKLFAGAIS